MLAAGAGTRLLPLTRVRPKPLCPVDNQPLVDHALGRLAGVTDSVAVNLHHGRAALEAHLDGRVHLSIEEPEPLGTAGALAALAPWIDGRPAVVVNGDTWCPGGIDELTAGWDGQGMRVLVVGGDVLTATSRVAGCALPWARVRTLKPEASGLYEVVWSPAAAAGELEVVRFDGLFHDCGTPAGYLAANLTASGGASVVGPGAVVDGRIERSVVWPGARVYAGEHLIDAIRVDERMTVLVR